MDEGNASCVLDVVDPPEAGDAPLRGFVDETDEADAVSSDTATIGGGLGAELLLGGNGGVDVVGAVDPSSVQARLRRR